MDYTDVARTEYDAKAKETITTYGNGKTSIKHPVEVVAPSAEIKAKFSLFKKLPDVLKLEIAQYAGINPQAQLEQAAHYYLTNQAQFACELGADVNETTSGEPGSVLMKLFHRAHVGDDLNKKKP